jgi:hypothetical protein
MAVFKQSIDSFKPSRERESTLRKHSGSSQSGESSESSESSDSSVSNVSNERAVREQWEGKMRAE